jgi:hypothetical protein
MRDGCSLVKLVLNQKMAPPYGNRKAKNVHSTSLVERVTATSGWALVAGVRIVSISNILRAWFMRGERGEGAFIRADMLRYYLFLG